MNPHTNPTRAMAEHSGRTLILRFQGDITSASKDAVLGMYERHSGDAIRNILLDFSKVPYLNSSGIALIIQLLMAAARSGQMVHTFGLTPHFQKVFTMIGLAKYTTIHQDEAAAQAAASENHI